MFKTVTGERPLREKGVGRAWDHSVGLTPRAGQRTIGKRGQWKSLGWQCSSRGAQQGRWGVFEPTVSSEETCVSRDWACSRVPAQLSAGCERSLGSLVSTQKWWQISEGGGWICGESVCHSWVWLSGLETGAQRKAVGPLGGTASPWRRHRWPQGCSGDGQRASAHLLAGFPWLGPW